MSGGGVRDHLAELMAQAGGGLQRLTASFRSRQLGLVLAAQGPDGGFAGRQGGSDLYYTSFALRAACLLDGDGEEGLWAGAAAWLRRRGPVAADIVEGFCLLYCLQMLARRGQVVWGRDADEAARRHVEATLAGHRIPQGGYAKAQAGEGSVYHTFLAALCWELVGQREPFPEMAERFVRSRQCRDGGFADVGEGRHVSGGTNPTAAAVGLLAVLGRLDEETAEAAARFLAGMQRRDGGFAAYLEVQGSDLMSTFTALVALSQAGAVSRIRRADVARFAGGLAAPAGGFRGAPLDDQVDLEYTFYGLGTLGLLAREVASACPCRLGRAGGG